MAGIRTLIKYVNQLEYGKAAPAVASGAVAGTKAPTAQPATLAVAAPAPALDYSLVAHALTVKSDAALMKRSKPVSKRKGVVQNFSR